MEEHVRQAIDSGSASDGTVRLLCLLAIAHSKARHLGNSIPASLIAFEEPETGLHPHLAEQVVNVLRSASRHSQIIVTTHSPTFLDHLEPEEVILCDKIEGYTRMRRASSIAEISTFRKNFSLGELWLQGPLGAVP